MNLFAWIFPKKTMNPFIPITGRITCYGYPGDSTPDENSKNSIGAWDNTLIDLQDFAASPDIIDALNAAGIHPLDKVDVQLATGTVLSLKWGDKTASDKVAKEMGLKPLRGRFDLYCKHKKSALDGTPVTGFRRA